MVFCRDAVGKGQNTYFSQIAKKETDMDLVIPDFGLLFWMVVSFTILLLLLKKFAWKPLLKMLKMAMSWMY